MDVTAVTGEGGRQHGSVVDFFKGGMDWEIGMANTLPIIVSISRFAKGRDIYWQNCLSRPFEKWSHASEEAP